ncbi:MAG: hypothetical protein A3K19_07990 [Lentisphaerae bacterium RIFOXYB12_FULL_65_16]|nr:MAG: hypothetical protein A3K18_08840 [Lentisphaerae bacterium RIFOXYA12_64_32]OGV87588.1 MAG: hypothetical protein A3K19_07990 [Lentisphaerae bacterium RIFOXYB12_FULL_65_16]
MSVGQDSVQGTSIAAKYAACVHVKDMKRTPDGKAPGRSVIGKDDVDIPGCLRALEKAGYKGYLALEYEGEEDERTGVPESIRYLKEVLGRG